MKRMEAFVRRLILLAVSLALICSIFPGLSSAENPSWDCPECGRKGNTGKFCGNCALPSPAPVPEQDVVSFDKLIRMYDTNIVKEFYDIREDAKKWISWTTNSAPQSVKELPLFPDFIVPLYQSLEEALGKLSYETEDTGNTYTIRSNIAEKLVLISSDEYYNNISSRSDEAVLLLEQNISGSADIRDIKMLDSSDSSISFSYPEGTSVRINELQYQFRYFYYDSVEEIITIHINDPERKAPYYYIDVIFQSADTSIRFLPTGTDEIEIEIYNRDGKMRGTEWLDYDLQSGKLTYWDMAFYEEEETQ